MIVSREEVALRILSGSIDLQKLAESRVQFTKAEVDDEIEQHVLMSFRIADIFMECLEAGE